MSRRWSSLEAEDPKICFDTEAVTTGGDKVSTRDFGALFLGLFSQREPSQRHFLPSDRLNRPATAIAPLIAGHGGNEVARAEIVWA